MDAGPGSRAHILFILPDLGGGGAQKVMLSVAGGIDRARFAPRILVAGGSQAFAGHVPQGVPFENAGASRLREGLPWLIRRIRALEPQVVVSVMGYLNFMLLASRKLLPSGTRLVVREANAVAATLDALPRWLPGTALYRSLYPRASAIVSPTATIAREIERLAPRTLGRTCIIANPVDIAGSRAAVRDIRREPGNGLRLVSAGRLTRQKGYDRLLTVMQQLPSDTHLTIFGAGEDRAALDRQARSSGISGRVHLAGFSNDVACWIAGADAFVLPSRWEGLPNVVLESLALGTPVIASTQAAVGELALQCPAGAVTVCQVETEFPAAICAIEASATACELRPSLLPYTYSSASAIASWEGLIQDVLGREELQ